MRRVALIVSVAVAIAACILWWRAASENRAAEARIAVLEAERAALRSAHPAAGGVTEPPPEEKRTSPAPAAPNTIRVPAPVDAAGYLKAIDELRAQIAQLHKDLSAAREEAARSAAQATVLQGEQAKLQAALAESRDDLLAARRATEALQAENKVKSDRIARAETEEKLARERLAKAEAVSAQASSGSREIEDLNRRRETYLNNLLRRFREVSDLYRNFALNAQTREGAGPVLNAGDLSRIQSTIQSAEDDLRQLQALNARAAQIGRTKP